jgi:diguanylate cyclase (GGDEF)-like protein/putative nucleotidyltransferase with HDIG domain
LFPDSIGEACFIDRAGPEIARMVRGLRATSADLSPDESAAPFFGPTFALRHGQVYQARPYVSPDTKEWVISNSTLLPTTDGSKPAIVHFEVTIESFRKVAARLGSQFNLTVVDADSGQVLIDGRRPQQVGAPLGVPDDHRFRPVISAGKRQGSSSVGDRPVAYQRLQQRPGNANQWYVVAAARAPVGPLYGVSAWSIALVVAALALLVFAAISFLTHHRLLVATSMTDPLTGISNRRQLKLDLERGLKQASPASPLLLMLFDLNGFKAYNDTFGHPAGDALLARLGAALAGAVEDFGRAYRMGGDEFCVLATAPVELHAAIAETSRLALSEHGNGFDITAALGTATLEWADSDPADALREADRRMYAEKNGRRASAGGQSTAVLLRVIAERSPDLGEHVDGVAALAEKVAVELGMNSEDRTAVWQAAMLHDIGKSAVPDAILTKPGPLDESEWAFMRRHTVIGERILQGAPALAAAAPLVRSSHERFDGSGYPDCLAGGTIPLGARIIAVCDAYDAMVSGRPYREALSTAHAREELERCAGSQFDPKVVRAFLTTLERSQREGSQDDSRAALASR